MGNYYSRAISYSIIYCVWICTASNKSFCNVTFCTFVERLSQITLCQGITLSDSRKEINFLKHVLPKKYITLSSPSCIRYHLMIIKFCLNLAAKSSSAYKDLRYDKKTGILVLSRLRTLRGYKNYIRPIRGFNPDINPSF